MKRIIDIPDNEYKYTCERTLSDRTFWDDAIRNGIPLDDVKAENKGEWKRISPAGIYECSCCGLNVMTNDIECYKFCHRCGASMKGGEQMSDLIDRAEVIKLLDEQCQKGMLTFFRREHHVNCFRELVKAIPSVEYKGEWIPVSERLPEIHQDVLLELRSGEMLTGFKAETEPYFYCHGVDGCYVEPQNVIAWMPLPEPYMTEEGGE